MRRRGKNFVVDERCMHASLLTISITHTFIATPHLPCHPLPPSLALSLFKMLCSGIINEECKVMDSKQAPVWVVMKSDDTNAPNFIGMFKVGDDLKQDQMTLQVRRHKEDTTKKTRRRHKEDTKKTHEHTRSG